MFLVCEGVKSFSRVRLFATPWTVAYQAPPSMGFSRQEYWSGLPFPSLGGLPYPGIEPRSPTFQADVLTSGPPGKPPLNVLGTVNLQFQGPFVPISLWSVLRIVESHVLGTVCSFM